MSIYSSIPLFERDNSRDDLNSFNYANYDLVKDLIVDYLLDYPRNKINRKYFSANVPEADIAGVFCEATNPEDIEILDGLFGFVDIPASMSGFCCDIVKLNSNRTFFFVYDKSKINPTSIKNINLLAKAKF